MTTIYRQDPERGFRMWHMREIYRADNVTSTTALYVPNVGDVVFDGIGSFLYVTAIDSTTAEPTLSYFNPAGRFEGQADDINDLHAGLSYYQPHVSNRIFIDTTTVPYSLSIDPRFKIYGSESVKMRLYRGTDTSNTGTVISQNIDERGAVVSELVSLLPIFDNSSTIKRPARAHTGYSLDDGEIVTAVIYNTAGGPTGEHRFIVKNANVIAAADVSNIYIEDIELISPLISSDDPTLIENTLNIPFYTSAMTCRVHYSDGNYVDYPVDGTKAKMHGLNNFNTSLLGPTTNLVLSYYPSSSEQSINLQGTIPAISKTYRLANIPVGNDYAFKLYIIPYWIGTGYKLQVRLTDVEYSLNMDVTNKTTIKGPNEEDFNGYTMGVTQTLDLILNLDDVLPGAYPNHTHAQRVVLTLDEPNSTNQNNWIIDYLGDGQSVYGPNMYATVSSLDRKPFDIHCGFTASYEWLQSLYYTLDPIFNPSLTDKAPVPTHFRLRNGGVNGRSEIGTYSLEEFNTTHYLGLERSWDRNWPLIIDWLIIANNREQILGMSPLSIESDV